jgi:hypothetical protein
VLWEAEQTTLADGHRPKLPGPVVDVAENVPVERLQVGQVVASQQRVTPQLGDPHARKIGLACASSPKSGRFTIGLNRNTEIL